jgi:hypothetical protein
MNTLRTLLVSILLLSPTIGLAQDPIAELQNRMRRKEVHLEYNPKHGYLISLLKNLNVPVSSQTLVFSKTSLQSERISPATPRALYFNDDVYVAWVQGAASIEIMSVDLKRGAIFYALDQSDDGRPEFEQVTGHVCSVCHYVEGAGKFVPKLMFSSIIPDGIGNVEGAFPIPTSDQSPMEERWGGWYVTGTHGSQKHLGNVFLKTPRSPAADLSGIDFARSSNMTDLSLQFDTSLYLSPHSDIVALMVLAHQIEIHNLIAIAGARPDLQAQDTGEPLVKAMLFSGAVALKEPIKGTSSFTADFPAMGPKDSRGRSLRDLDLQTRLFRYPLSYMIYSKPFDEMPDSVKAYVFRRLREILTGQDKSPAFAHLSNSDRQAILEILRETRPEFR